MKFALVLEAVDKASRAIKAVATAQKLAGKTAVEAADKAARAQEKATSTQEAANRVMTATERLGDKHRKGLAAQMAQMTKLNVLTAKFAKIGAAINNNGWGEVKTGAAKALAGMRGAMRRALKISAVGAVGGGGFGALFMKPAAQYSQLKAQLQAVTKSAVATKQAMDWVQAQQMPPHGIMDLTAGFVALRRAGIDPTKGALQAVADAATAQGKSMAEVTGAMQASFAGDYEGLNALGIAAQRQGKYIAYVFADNNGKMKRIRAAAGDTGAQAAAMAEAMRQASGGAARNYGQTWDGMMARLGDVFDRLRLKVMDAGLYDYIQTKVKWVLGELDKLLAKFEKWSNDGQLRDWVKKLTDAIERGLTLAWQVAMKFYAAGQMLWPVVDKIAWAFGGWANVLPFLIALPFVPFLMQVASGVGMMISGFMGLLRLGKPLLFLFRGFGGVLRLLGGLLPWVGRALLVLSRGFISLGIAMMTTPVGWIIAGIAAIAGAAYLIYRYWDKIGPYFKALWAWVKGVFVGFWNWLKGFFAGQSIGSILLAAFMPIIGLPVLIYQSWDKIGPYMAALWNGVKNIVAAAWEGIKGLIGWETLQPKLAELAAGIAAKFTEIWNGVQETAQAAWARLAAIFSWDNIKAVFDAVKDGIIGVFKTIKEYVLGVFDSIGKMWNTIKGWFGGSNAAEAGANAAKAEQAVTAGQMPAVVPDGQAMVPKSQNVAAGGSTGSIVLTFAPNISITGAEPSAVQKAVQDIYAQFKRELPRLMEEATRRKERLAY
ncbi:hypothetical protein [Candidatus Tokpelaia sp.]|uniref:hypothetical protein n=1 Tax=Candidatus Tokpelaia sp. TaxID=2233777 RepID=UPI001238D1AA|nr:hypothetical protein [Candidatus Tokpelaia sp.]KAA6404495.1 hypothetical protein DPQ22_09700 [Candidatus Tokpelaia sp.]